MDAAIPAPMHAADEAGSQAVRVPPAFPSFGAVSGRSQAAQALIDQGPAPQKPAAAQAGVQRDMPMPQPATGRSGRVEGRVKTRLLGFGTGDLAPRDPFAAAEPQRQDGVFPVGWLVVIQGPGRGASFPLYSGVSQIGRGEDQTVRLDFGDTSISRSNHAAIAYDPEQRGFFLGHGGKANMVRLNNRPVLSTEDLHHGAQIRIGETTLRFVAFCDDGFAWGKDEGL
ncbi:MAG: FHA domain-containing protein [Rhodobacteraceae bacterium]|nr:MAG: FHA domain-containing protein [Paracoccaceae bacterium]